MNEEILLALAEAWRARAATMESKGDCEAQDRGTSEAVNTALRIGLRYPEDTKVDLLNELAHDLEELVRILKQ